MKAVNPTVSLGSEEENAIRYASGYVAMKLVKRYKEEGSKKAAQFVECLSNMAVNGDDSSFYAYTCIPPNCSLPEDNVDVAAVNWHNKVMEIMHACIPQQTLKCSVNAIAKISQSQTALSGILTRFTGHITDGHEL